MQPDAYCFHRSFDPAPAADFQVDRHYLLHALEGTIRLEADGRRWTLPPARAALIAADQPIRITILTRLTSASVLFARGFMAAPAATLSVFDMTPLARALIAECQSWGPETTLSPYAHQVFSLLGEVVLRLAQRPSPCVIPAPASSSLARAVDLTEAAAAEAPRFASIAKAAGLSERSLSRRLHDELGMTWTELLRRIRMTRAVELLATTDRPVTEIGLTVGYDSPSAFNAAFRDVMGCNPTEYRRSCRTNSSHQNPPSPRPKVVEGVAGG
ncbi:MAG: AraC family transcriptional regulator [Alphaproteobacteria bacterium]|nr:MAG: AraC family transcriptional regulator [Alphaproteobacteria bacterium]